MAKRRTAARTSKPVVVNVRPPARRGGSGTKTIVVAAPKAPARRRSSGRVSGFASRALENEVLMTAVGGGAVGLLVRTGKVPTFAGLSPEASLLVAGFLASKYLKVKWLDSMVKGAGAVVAYNWTSRGVVGEGYPEGYYPVAGYDDDGLDGEAVILDE